MPPIVIAGKIRRCRLATEIAVDALIVHVKPPCRVLRVFIYDVCHSDLFPFSSDLACECVEASALEKAR
jgi:hypothetical protein